MDIPFIDIINRNLFEAEAVYRYTEALAYRTVSLRHVTILFIKDSRPGHYGEC